MEGYVKLTVTPCTGGCNIEHDTQLEDVSMAGKAMLLEAFLEAIELPQTAGAALCRMLANGEIGERQK